MENILRPQNKPIADMGTITCRYHRRMQAARPSRYEKPDSPKHPHKYIDIIKIKLG